MTLACVVAICATALIAIHQWQKHEIEMVTGMSHLKGVQVRLASLESARAIQYDHAAFEDLKTKVEALRLAQGLRGSR